MSDAKTRPNAVESKMRPTETQAPQKKKQQFFLPSFGNSITCNYISWLSRPWKVNLFFFFQFHYLPSALAVSYRSPSHTRVYLLKQILTWLDLWAHERKAKMLRITYINLSCSNEQNGMSRTLRGGNGDQHAAVMFSTRQQKKKNTCVWIHLRLAN